MFGGLSPATAAKPMLCVSSEGTHPCPCAQRGAEDHCAPGWGLAYPRGRAVLPWTCPGLQKSIPICLFEPPLLERTGSRAGWMGGCISRKSPPRCLWAEQNRPGGGRMALHKTASCEVTNPPWGGHRSPAWPSATCILQRVNILGIHS